MTDATLVYMPFGALERPSLGLGLLKASLSEAGVSCSVRYATFEFAERIGLELYSKLAWVREEMVGEWIFAGAAFPDHHPNVDEYLDAILPSFYPEGNGDARAFGRRFLMFAREEATKFVEDTALSIIAERPRIVGCSSTFNQNTAMLALLRRIKALAPEIVTVAGGANCEGEMGQAMAQHFPWLDYVASGEGEEMFPALCRQILEGREREPLPYGVLRQQRSPKPSLAVVNAPSEPPRASVDDLEICPLPDFDDYFAALERYEGRDFITPGLVHETARGCWWGAVHHCTFCGLNGGTMAYRSKRPERVAEELEVLSTKYGVDRFLMADNILDHTYYKTLLPKLAQLPEQYQLFYEIKANVSFEQLETLKNAGCSWIVAGVESLHDEVLKLMDKGTWGWLNTQLLKWTRGLGIRVSWNMLCGFPGERDEWYGETADWVELISHLEPPNDMRIIRFDRFSPHQANPGKYGLELRPWWPYASIYPLEGRDLERLVYFFEGVQSDPSHLNPFRHRRDPSAVPSLGGPGRDRLRQRIHEWVGLYRSDTPPILRMTLEDGRTIIEDTRPVAIRERHVLEGLADRVYRACDRATTPANIVRSLNEDSHGPAVDLEEIQAVLDTLVEDKLVARFGARHLALAVRGAMPKLPWKNQDGYPGGWFVYPRPTVIPPGFTQFLERSTPAE